MGGERGFVYKILHANLQSIYVYQKGIFVLKARETRAQGILLSCY